MQLTSIKNLQIIQLVEQSLPAPEILQFETSLWEILFAVNCIEKHTGDCPFKTDFKNSGTKWSDYLSHITLAIFSNDNLPNSKEC